MALEELFSIWDANPNALPVWDVAPNTVVWICLQLLASWRLYGILSGGSAILAEFSVGFGVSNQLGVLGNHTAVPGSHFPSHVQHLEGWNLATTSFLVMLLFQHPGWNYS